jgi:integrase
MSVRKRTWITAKGERKEAWIADYTHNGHRRQRTFARKKEAEAWCNTTKVEIRTGVHTPDAASITVKDAGDLWLRAASLGCERATVDSYRQHLVHHIVPYLGEVKLSRLSAPMVRVFEDKLAQGIAPVGTDPVEPRSRAMIRKIRVSLGSIIADAQEQGLVARNVVRELRAGRRRGKELEAEKRQRGKLKAGVNFPTLPEVKAILAAAEGRMRPFLLVAVFAGLRASELRGLRWSDVDFAKGEVHVRQRADRYREIGRPKSSSGERTVPIPDDVVTVLKEWRLACPKGPLDLCFPSENGSIQFYENIARRWWTVQVAAGVADVAKDAEGEVILDGHGEPVRQARYSGLHTLRHFFASWCLNRRTDGGLELPIKVVQERLGHSSIMMTADVYGHLFPRGDDREELAAGARLLLG